MYKLRCCTGDRVGFPVYLRGTELRDPLAMLDPSVTYQPPLLVHATILLVRCCPVRAVLETVHIGLPRTGIG